MNLDQQSEKAVNGWVSAVRLLARWIEKSERVDTLLATLPPKMAGEDRARCQFLLFGVIRHLGRLDDAMAKHMRREPRPILRAVLLVAGYELTEAGNTISAAEGLVPKIVHHAVEKAKSLVAPAEVKLVNAVVRKLAADLTKPAVPPAPDADAEALGDYYVHPVWLVERWLSQFGRESTIKLLEWNQTPPIMYARWRNVGGEAPDSNILEPTRWPGYYTIKQGCWSQVEKLVKQGKLYLQDPATRHAVELLAPKLGEQILDFCAAPGGKSLQIADMLEKAAAKLPEADRKNPEKVGGIVSFDLPDQRRISRLKENLAKVGPGVGVALVQGDVLTEPVKLLRGHSLPTEYPGILIDVPCSNTGVMRHRVDVRWRLEQDDIAKHAGQQVELLIAASKLVGRGGRIVYSTCSLETEENEGVIKAFLEKRGDRFELEKSIQNHPWVDGCDGAGAFLLRRIM